MTQNIGIQSHIYHRILPNFKEIIAYKNIDHQVLLSFWEGKDTQYQ